MSATSSWTCAASTGVGGGWAGIYFGYRRALAAQDASSICLFEAMQRIGGRTYSVRENDFVLDVGAYRFSPDMHLPGDLILHDLKLPTACYEPSCPNAALDFPPPFLFNYSAPLRRIVDPTTKLPAGYATALHAMLDKMKALGAKVFLGATLTGVTPPNGTPKGESTVLSFAGGATAHATGAVLLNLPRNKLLMMRDAIAPHMPPRTLRMLECVAFDAPQRLFHNHSLSTATALAKAYLYQA